MKHLKHSNETSRQQFHLAFAGLQAFNKIRIGQICIFAVLGIALLMYGCDSEPTTGVEDVAPLMIELSSPHTNSDGYSVVNQATVVISGTVTDGMGVTRMIYTLNGSAEQEISISTGSSVNFEFTIPALEPGSNHLVVWAFNGAGNQAQAQRLLVYAVVRYNVIVAGEANNGSSRPRAINASGDIAFKWESQNDHRGAQGFVWSAGALTELVLPDGHVLMGVSGINASRVAVGDLEDVGTGALGWRDVPVVWENGQPTVLPLLPGYSMGGASAINELGTIAGYVMDDGWDNWAAVLWRDGETMQISANAGASDINSSGVVTGSIGGGNDDRAFRWDNGQMPPLEPLAGMTISRGMAINDAGDVVGKSYNRDTFPRTRATLWRGTTATSLGEFPGGMYYRTWAVNNHLQAVGAVDYKEPGSRTSFISENGRMSLLNHLTNGEWDIIEAFGINDAGQIVALALRTGSDPFLNAFHSVLLEPVDAEAGAEMSVSVAQRPIRSEADRLMIERLRSRSVFDRLREGKTPR